MRKPWQIPRTKKPLTRKQLEADLAAAKERERRMIEENDRLRQYKLSFDEGLKQSNKEADDWRHAFMTLARLVNK